MTNDFIKGLRNKPDKTKIKILWAAGAISAIFVFSIWASTFDNYKIAFDNMLGEDVNNLKASFSEPFVPSSGYNVENYGSNENYNIESAEQETRNKKQETKESEEDLSVNEEDENYVIVETPAFASDDSISVENIIIEENNNSVGGAPLLPVE